MSSYQVIYKSVRHAYARVNTEGQLVLTIPKRLRGDQKFLEQLLSKGESLLARHAKRNQVTSFNEQGIQLFGEWIEWSEFSSDGKPLSQSSLDKKLKEILYEYAKEWLDIFSQQLGVPYRSLQIRKMKSRRGSCSSDQKIVLNLSLIYLSRECIQYVIAHEAAHLVEKNHAPAFWNVVGKLFPQYKKVRKELKNLLLFC
ncbi:MAG: M48 family metallopeptidase [Candidatus Absconditabacteria bacterium]|nr:M48 family metallopeptidase [Candidatus Absconditabacteria bacterium]MDD3868282.1 M48 family metallopeptidase [Candidatus Absconditabacteria bacterium]MDD4714029.1 M48 family metallopeptidase [Candidatus Absconditabacteria bacterium]